MFEINKNANRAGKDLMNRDRIQLARFPDQPKVLSPNDDGSLRMGDEGCPNESPSVGDATAYSKEERKLTQ